MKQVCTRLFCTFVAISVAVVLATALNCTLSVPNADTAVIGVTKAQAATKASKTGIKKVKDKYYYFNSAGKKVTGWKTVNGKKYYFAPKTGAMKTAG